MLVRKPEISEVSGDHIALVEWVSLSCKNTCDATKRRPCSASRGNNELPHITTVPQRMCFKALSKFTALYMNHSIFPWLVACIILWQQSVRSLVKYLLINQYMSFLGCEGGL